MILKDKYNLCRGLLNYRTGYKTIFFSWLVIVSIAVILNILIIILAINFLFVINNKEVTISGTGMVVNSDIIDKDFLNKIINHFNNQNQVGEKWNVVNHILVDPSVAK